MSKAHFGGKSLHGTHQNSEADVAKSSKAIQPGNPRRLAHGFPFATTNTPSSSSHHHHRHPLHYCTLPKPSRPLPPSNFPILVICLHRTLCPAAAIESSVAGPRKDINTTTKSRRVSLLTVDTAHSSDFRDTSANTKTSSGFRQSPRVRRALPFDGVIPFDLATLNSTSNPTTFHLFFLSTASLSNKKKQPRTAKPAPHLQCAVDLNGDSHCDPGVSVLGADRLLDGLE